MSNYRSTTAQAPGRDSSRGLRRPAGFGLLTQPAPPRPSSMCKSKEARRLALARSFRQGATGAFSDTLTLPVPINGTSVSFFVVGKFGRPSVNNGDVRIEARAGTTLVGSVAVMVRIRKNANTLTAGERNRFVAAFAQLNNQGAGRFADFRNMHTNVSSPQAHGAPGFLPWHRAYLLDLERELQAIDPSVALPYWRFDQPAPNLFTPDFFGTSSAGGPSSSATPTRCNSGPRMAPRELFEDPGTTGTGHSAWADRFYRSPDPGSRDSISCVP